MVASYFDVDGTLVASNLLHPTLFYLKNLATPWQSAKALGRTLAGAPRMALAELFDRRTFNELLFSTYQGISEDRLHLLADEAFQDTMLPHLFLTSRELLDRARNAGHEIVLISGALDFILERLAAHLGGATLIANRLELKNGYATGKLVKPVVAGPEKARLVREHAKERGYDLAECFAYSDSYSDVPMLSVVGHPAAVNPDPRLAMLAKAYSWPIFRLSKHP